MEIYMHLKRNEEMTNEEMTKETINVVKDMSNVISDKTLAIFTKNLQSGFYDDVFDPLSPSKTIKFEANLLGFFDCIHIKKFSSLFEKSNMI